MTSQVEGSDRTVYKNKSAHQDDMFLLVETDKTAHSSFRMQIAEVVTSPEVFSGYSHCAVFTQVHQGNQPWMAIGDERTFIFVFMSWYAEQTSYRSWSSYGASVVYIGDFEVINGTNAKGWGLLARGLQAGKMDQQKSRGIPGTFNLAENTSYISNSGRPITSVPGETWSEDAIYSHLSSFLPQPRYSSSLQNPPYLDPADFIANVQLKAEWFLTINRNYLFKLRGVFNLWPALCHHDTSYKRNWGKIVTVDGEDYLPFKTKSSYQQNEHMTFYIQTTGDW